MNGRKFLKIYFLLFLLLSFFLNSGCGMNAADSWKDTIPNEIRLGKTLAMTNDWLGSPGGGCGGAIFQLEESTAIEIQDKEEAFFEGLSKSYINWTSGTMDDQSHLSFQCAVQSSAKRQLYKDKLREALSSKDYYFGVVSEGSKTKILIYPDERLVYIGYWN